MFYMMSHLKISYLEKLAHDDLLRYEKNVFFERSLEEKKHGVFHIKSAN